MTHSLLSIRFDWDISSSRGKRDAFFIHRTMTLLNNLTNLSFGSYTAPAQKLVLLTNIAASIYLVIRISRHFGITLYLATLMDAMGMVLIIPPAALAMSKVFTLSAHFHDKMESSLIFENGYKEGRRKWRRRLRSMAPLRSKIGPFYHMESKAKLTMVDNLANATAFLLINF